MSPFPWQLFFYTTYTTALAHLISRCKLYHIRIQLPDTYNSWIKKLIPSICYNLHSVALYYTKCYNELIFIYKTWVNPNYIARSINSMSITIITSKIPDVSWRQIQLLYFQVAIFISIAAHLSSTLQCRCIKLPDANYNRI